MLIFLSTDEREMIFDARALPIFLLARFWFDDGDIVDGLPTPSVHNPGAS